MLWYVRISELRDVWLFAFNLVKLLLCIDKETEGASAHNLENQHTGDHNPALLDLSPRIVH